MDEAELAACASTDGDGVRRMLGFLQDNKYVDVRYAEEGVYCVRPLPEGKTYFSREREARRACGRQRRDAALFSALGAFFGSLLGALAVWLFALAF